MAEALKETKEKKLKQKVANPQKLCKWKAQEMEALVEEEVDSLNNDMQP